MDERLVLEEVRVAPHPLPHVMHRARVLRASRLRAVETRTRPVSDRDVRLPTARVGITELHIGDAPGVGELQGGGEQHRGIHTTKLPDRHHRLTGLTHTKQRKAIFFVPPLAEKQQAGAQKILMQILRSINDQQL